jgi:hypothetical protein
MEGGFAARDGVTSLPRRQIMPPPNQSMIETVARGGITGDGALGPIADFGTEWSGIVA